MTLGRSRKPDTHREHLSIGRRRTAGWLSFKGDEVRASVPGLQRAGQAGAVDRRTRR